MKRKLAIFMSFVMLFSTAVILPADKEHPAKAEETVTASGYWTDVAEPFKPRMQVVMFWETQETTRS